MRRFLVVALLVIAVPAAAQQPGEPVPIRIESKILGETRTVLVRTPPSYVSGARSYPVLYMTDGETQLAHTAATVDFLVRNGRMPEVIIVGVTNTDRTRDLTPTHVERSVFDGNTVTFPTSGGADKFLAFLGKELIPHIESNYRTQPFRVFSGHSFGGLFTVYALMTQPRLFNAWMAISPTFHWDNEYITRKMAEFIKANPSLESTVVFSVGDEGEVMNGGFAKLKAMLERGAPKGLDVMAVQMMDEDHGSVVLPTHFAGLKKIFEPWRFAIERNDDPLKLYERARTHYAALSKRAGYTVPIPEPTTNAIGYRLMAASHRKEAIEVFRANVEAYPQSANVYDSLGEAYEGAGQLALARENYERAASIGAKINDPNTNIYRTNRDRVAKAISEKPRQQSSIDARVAELGGTLERNAEGAVVKIDLHGTKVTAADLAFLAEVPQLETLDLRLTTIDDSALDHLRSLQRLTFLNLFRTAVGDEGLRKIAHLEELRTLLIGGTGVTDDGLVALVSLPNLRKISVFRTAVSDRGIAQLKQLPNLEVLLIGGSKITAAGEAELREARPNIRFTEPT